MLATKAMLDAVATSVLDGVCANGNFTVKLSKTNFNPADPSGFTEADFPGYAAKAATAWGNGVDAATGMRALTLLAPAGGFRYTANGGLTEPQTIYGWLVTSVDANITMGGGLLPSPITISEPGGQINLPPIQFGIPANALI